MRSLVVSALVCLAASGALTAPAAAADTTGCADPAWAAQRMPGYAIDSCQVKEWAALHLDLADGGRTVYGRRTVVDYQLRSGAEDHAAAEVRDFYAAAAERAGARLISSPDIYQASLERESASGDTWYVYEHGSGNDASTGSFTLTTLEVAPLRQDVQAKVPTGALDTRANPCTNPPWLVTPLAGFKLSSCDGKEWDRVDVELANGSKAIEGARYSATYSAVHEDQAPTAIAVLKNYVDALQAIGARLESDPGSIYNAVLTQKTPQGEYWYVYEHGGGDDDTTTSYTVTTVFAKPFRQEVEAQLPAASLEAPPNGCANPPWLKKQFSYFTLSGCTWRDLDSVALDLAGGTKTVAGRYLSVDYDLTDQARDPAALTVRKNFANALEAIGAREMGDPNDIYKAVFVQKTPHGDYWYIYEHGGGNEESTGSYSLLTLNAVPPPQKPCTVEVYGVNFDFNKATLRPESEPVLEQVLAIFKADPKYAAEVGGHTDNVGTSADNMKLSDERAEAVKAWLVAHGVAASRISARGYGDTRPLVPNTTAENRFRNRRVELRRLQCQ